MGRVDPFVALRGRIEEASNGGKDAGERALALKRVRYGLLAALRDVEGRIEEAEGDREREVRREVLRRVRENADLREQLERRGLVAPERLDAMGLVSHDALDEAGVEGRLEEFAAGALAKLDNIGQGSGVLGKWLEKLHPRDRGGQFAKKPGSGVMTAHVGPDAGGRGTVKRTVKAPAAKRPERVFKTQKVMPEELVAQQKTPEQKDVPEAERVGFEGLAPGARPAGMSERQWRQERARTPEGARRTKGPVQAPEEIEKAKAKDREKRQRGMAKRVEREVAKGVKGGAAQHFNPAGKVSQKALLDYVRNTLTTPSTADAHSEVRGEQRFYHPDRKQLHDTIIDTLLRRPNEDGTISASNEYLPSQETPEVLFMGGGYAAGKSSAEKLLRARNEVPADSLKIDPDQIKSMLPEFVATAGHDPEANLRVYEEAWDIAQELQRQAKERKLNVVVDGITNTSADEVFGRVQSFKDAGYGNARIAYVDVPTDVALTRAADRMAKAIERGDGPNMRHIPEPIMRAVHRDVAATIPAVMGDPRREGLGVHVDVYDGQSGALPIASIAPDAAEPTIHNDPAWARLREKADEKIAGVDAAKSATDPWAAGRLAENHEDFFNVTPQTTRVSLDKLRPSKQPESQPKSVDNAERFMRQAAAGEKGKRDPIRVRDDGDGTYTVLDGNATYGAAVRNDWKDLPVEVVNAKPGGETTGGAAVRPGDDEARAVHQRIVESVGDVPAEAPPQPASTEEELYALAPAAQEGFVDILDRGVGVSASLGARTHQITNEDDFKEAVAAVEADPDSPHILLAPLKGTERAREKVEGKYKGDWGKLSDVVRGTVVVPDIETLEQAMDAVRREAEANGWKVSALENRMVNIQGEGKRAPGPTSSGYTDFNIRLEAPNGIQAELQFNTSHMVIAKEGTPGGHKLFEEERTIVDRANARGLPLTAAERARVFELRKQQTAIYTQAWEAGIPS